MLLYSVFIGQRIIEANVRSTSGHRYCVAGGLCYIVIHAYHVQNPAALCIMLSVAFFIHLLFVSSSLFLSLVLW